MAVNLRHKKARMIRDFMIETKTLEMFKEEERNDTIFFRSIYPMGENDNKQVVITINDTVYLGVQSLLLNNIPEECNPAILDCLNECNLELPTVKYVLTKDQCVVVSMFIPADHEHFNAALIMGTIVELMKNVSKRHYEKIKAAIV